MQPRFVDLHTHTTASDGTDTPRGLIRKAAEAGLAAVAVTDHDTISGLDEAEAAGRDFGVEVIRGCELGVQGQYGEIHLLGLWLPRDCAPLEAALARLRTLREERNREMLEKLRGLGIAVSYDEVLEEAKGESVGPTSPGCFKSAASYPPSRRHSSFISAITARPTCPVRCLRPRRACACWPGPGSW